MRWAGARRVPRKPRLCGWHRRWPWDLAGDVNFFCLPEEWSNRNFCARSSTTASTMMRSSNRPSSTGASPGPIGSAPQHLSSSINYLLMTAGAPPSRTHLSRLLCRAYHTISPSSSRQPWRSLVRPSSALANTRLDILVSPTPSRLPLQLCHLVCIRPNTSCCP